MRYILLVSALRGACDVIQNGRHIRRHLGFYRKLEIVKKRLKLEIFHAGHEEYDIIKHFLLSVDIFCIFHLKRVNNANFSSKMA